MAISAPSVDIFIPCFVDQIYPQTAFNTVKLLEHLGCQVNYNPQQTCCGQPAFNAGYMGAAQSIIKKFLKDFGNSDHYIVSPSASCVGMIRNHFMESMEGKNMTAALEKQLYQLAKNTFELSEFIVDILGVEEIPGSRFEAVATYHDSCAALRECGILTQPRLLLQNVAGLNLIEMKENETCCGFGGTFAVKFQAISTAMAEQKIDHAAVTEAEYLISTDASCLMHLEGYLQKNRKKLKTIHIADVLAFGI